MKARVALFVAVFCFAAVTCLNLVCVREVISDQQREISEQKTSLLSAETDLAGLRTQLKRTSTALRQSRDAEETAKREKELLKVESAAELLTVRQELEHAKTELASVSGAFTQDQFAKTGKQIYELQKWVDVYKEENRLLKASVRRLKVNDLQVPDKPDVFPMPADIRGKVAACDPKWQFVVVNVGQEQGAKPHGELLVSRNGQLIGWLVISNVAKDRCIANLKQGWQLTEVLEGDSVMPAHPESYLDLFL